MRKQPKPRMTWFYWLIAINLFFVAMTIATAYVPRAAEPRFFFRAFTLGLEMNIGAWWSGVCLLSAALLAYGLGSNSLENNRVPWLILATIFTGLSLDEIGSIHERAGGWRNIIPIGATGAVLLCYVLIRLYRNQATRRTSLMILAAFALLGTVALQEWLEMEMQWTFWMSGIRVGVEEGTEIAGITLVLIALVGQWRYSSDALDTLPPNPFRFQHFSVVVVSGLMLHFFLSYLTEYYVQIGRHIHGSPAVWYPSALLFVLAISYFNIRISTDGRRREWMVFLSAFFLFASVSCMYVITPRSEASILSNSVQIMLCYAFLLGLIILPVIVGMRCGTFPLKRLPLVFALMIALFITFAADQALQTYIPRYILTGVICYSLTLLYSVDGWQSR